MSTPWISCYKSIMAFSITMAGISGVADGAVYLGTTTDAPLADLTGMTFTVTSVTGMGGADATSSAGTAKPLSTSKFLDGNYNHSDMSGAPIGSNSHFNGNAIRTVYWVLDLGQTYNINDLILYAGTGNRVYGMLSTKISVSATGADGSWVQVGTTDGVRLAGDNFPAGTTWEQNANITDDVTARYIRIAASDFMWGNFHKLDELDLFITPVPEPATCALLAGACLLPLLYRGRKG